MEGLIVVGTFLGDLFARIVFSGTIRSARGSLEEMARRFPRSRVLRAELVTWPGLEQMEAATVRFVVANAHGLSFRDAYGLELLKVVPADANDVELVESGGSISVRAFGKEGDSVDFWLDGVEQADGLATLREALAGTP